MLATVGNLRVQSPVAREGVTAVSLHGSGRGRACSPASRPREANEGWWLGCAAQDPRLVADGPRVVPAQEQDHCEPWKSAQSPGRTSTRRSTAPSSRSAANSSRAARSEPRSSSRPTSAPSLVVVVERAARYGAGRGCECGRRELEAGTRRGHQQVRAPVPRSLCRRRREQRRDPGVPLGNARRPRFQTLESPPCASSSSLPSSGSSRTALQVSCPRCAPTWRSTCAS